MIRYADISAAIQIRHLQVELSGAMTFSPSDLAHEAALSMAARGFDQAPVVESGRLIGVVEARELLYGATTVGDAMTPVGAQHLVSAHAPVSDALRWFLDTPCLYVLDGRRISGFVMEADLNKQPMRTYFYLLVASLEASLAADLRSWAGSDEECLHGLMSDGLRRRVLEAREDARAVDGDADLVTYLLFGDILRLAQRIPSITSGYGVRTKGEWREMTGSLVELRNAVMHPNRDLICPSRPLARLVELDEHLNSLLSAADRSVEPTTASG